MIGLLYCFIVNSVAGNGRAYKTWFQIEKILKEKNLHYCVHFTKKAKHATEIVQEHVSKKDADVIIVVGGDGTVHEVINGLVGSTIPLGIIPAGSGNDFCRAMDIPTRFDQALERIFKNEQTIIDIGCINTNYFVTVVGVGFDGQVAQTTNRSKYKKALNVIRLGGFSYIIGVLKVLSFYKPTNVDLKINKNKLTFSNVWLIAVANSPFYARGMLICPQAKSNDGVFDICIVQGISRWELLRIFPSVFKGKHITHPSIKMLKANEIEILSDSPMIAHGDGEIIAETPIKISVQPNTLNVL